MALVCGSITWLVDSLCPGAFGGNLLHACVVQIEIAFGTGDLVPYERVELLLDPCVEAVLACGPILVTVELGKLVRRYLGFASAAFLLRQFCLLASFGSWLWMNFIVIPWLTKWALPCLAHLHWSDTSLASNSSHSMYMLLMIYEDEKLMC